MITLPKSMLESRLSLSSSDVTMQSSEVLVIATQMSSVRIFMAVIFALLSLVFVALVFMSWKEIQWLALWPWGFLAPFFFVIAIVVYFGDHKKVFDKQKSVATLEARLGPLFSSEQLNLSKQGVVHLTFYKEMAASTGDRMRRSTRHYQIDIEGRPELGFTIPNDREKARAFARQLADFLNYTIKDEVEDDGVERNSKEDEEFSR